MTEEMADKGELEMPRYLLSYHGEMRMEDMPSDPEAIQAVMAQWGAWYESMGESLVDGGAPIAFSTAINADGAAEAPAQLSGYTVVECDDMEAATTIAQGSPVLANGHSVQISQCIDMG